MEAATWLGHQGERQDRRLWLPGGLGVLHWRSSPSLCKIRKPCFFVCLYHLCLYLNHSQSICDYVSIYIYIYHYIDLLFQSKEQFPLTGVGFACCFKWYRSRDGNSGELDGHWSAFLWFFPEVKHGPAVTCPFDGCISRNSLVVGREMHKLQSWVAGDAPFML